MVGCVFFSIPDFLPRDRLVDVTLAIDAMGGDHGTAVTVRAAVDYLKHSPGDTIVLVGIPDAIESELRNLGKQTNAHLRIHPASEVVGMDESPQSAMRGKKDSSMRVSIDLVKARSTAPAAVSPCCSLPMHS